MATPTSSVQNESQSILRYVLQSALLWTCVPILWSFIPSYLNSFGLRSSQVGILLALNPLMALIMQPIFGMKADKASSKNKVFNWLMAGTVLSALLFPLHTSYAYMLLIGAILSIFQSALAPVSESIALESLDRMKKPYGPVRLAGTIGFAIVSILAGRLMVMDKRSIFVLAAFIGILNILHVWRLPVVKGHQTKGNKVTMAEIFHDRLLTLFILLSVIAQLSISFFMSFLPLIFESIGGDRSQLGVVYFLMALGEVPFLLNAEKIIGKLGIRKALVISMSVIGLRFLLLSFITAPVWVFALAAINGFTFIVFAYSLAVYVNRTVRKELRTTGQTVLGIAAALGRIIGALAGGFLLESLGTTVTLRICFALCMTALILFAMATRGMKQSVVQQ